jgi:hypothetical protein
LRVPEAHVQALGLRNCAQLVEAQEGMQLRARYMQVIELVIQPDHGDKYNRSAKGIEPAQTAPAAGVDGNFGLKRITQ